MSTKAKLAVVATLIVGIVCGVYITARWDLIPLNYAQSSTNAKPGIQPVASVKTVEPPSSMINLQDSFAQISENLNPCVVNISTTRKVKVQSPFSNDFFGDDIWERFFGRDNPFRRRSPGRELEQHSLGSGFIIRSNGYIITNNHVVQGVDEVQVTIHGQDGEDQGEFDAEIVGTDPDTDLAVLKVETDRELPTVPLGDSEKVRVGDWAIAIGNPFGFENSLTVGVISAKARDIDQGPYTDFLQTDAAINPGNSGGPLINIRGEVIGVNTAIYSRSGGYMGMGFAIPINLAKRIIGDLIEKGHYSRGYIGITFQELDEKLARVKGIDPDTPGVLIADVLEDTPAAEAGLEAGDVLVEVDGEKINTGKELQRKVAALGAGTKTKVKVIRDGKERTFTMTLAERPSELAGGQQTGRHEEQPNLGLELQDVTPEVADELQLKTDKGALVLGVEPGSPAYDAEFMQGDVIIKADRKPVDGVDDFSKIIDDAKPGDDVLIVVERRGYNRFLVIEIPKEED